MCSWIMNSRRHRQPRLCPRGSLMLKPMCASRGLHAVVDNTGSCGSWSSHCSILSSTSANNKCMGGVSVGRRLAAPLSNREDAVLDVKVFRMLLSTPAMVHWNAVAMGMWVRLEMTGKLGRHGCCVRCFARLRFCPCLFFTLQVGGGVYS